MTDDVKAPEAPSVPNPEPKAPDSPSNESFIENRRQEVEKLVETANTTFPEPEIPVEPETKPEASPKDEKAEESDPLERIKKSVQKRIDKVVAQKKSVEDELAETRAELERLRAQSKPAEPESKPDDGKPPTIEQVKAYIVKMRAEGNVEEELAAIDYMVELKKNAALKEVEDRQSKAKSEADSVKAKQLQDWTDLQRDYIVYDGSGNPDPKNDLTLSNQDGLLYRTALSLYNDKELHKDFYNDPDLIRGFRRAVSDAYREIHQQGLLKTPKGEPVIPRTPRVQLADPGTDTGEETPSNDSNSLSDADKVREEIKNRNKHRFLRPVPKHY